MLANCFCPGSVFKWTHTWDTQTKKELALSFIWLKDRGLFCSCTKKHHMHELTCSTGKKKFGKIGHRPCTSSELCLCVSNNVAFYFVSTAKPPNGDTMVTFGCSDTMFSSTVLTEAGELQIPLLQVSSLFMRFPNVTIKFLLHCLWQWEVFFWGGGGDLQFLINPD